MGKVDLALPNSIPWFQEIISIRMATPRLTFLYPCLFKQSYCFENKLALSKLRPRHPKAQGARISTTNCLKQEAYPQRYGTAAEPQPPPPKTSAPEAEKSLAGAIEKEINPPAEKDTQKEFRSTEKSSNPTSRESKEKPDTPQGDAKNANPETSLKNAAELNALQSHPKEEPDTPADAKNRELAKKSKPLETVLQMGASTVEKPEEHHTPHLHAPPYVHHFDTFTLVRDLERGGFTEDQSITIMKAVRALLAINLGMAKEGLVSKSDVENVRASFL